MAFDLIPRAFWTFPSSLSSILDQDEDWLSLPNTPSGLSVSEDDKNVYVEAAVPGVKPEDVDVTFEKGILWIKAKGEEKQEGRKYYREASNSYSYRVAVPGDIDHNTEPNAVCKNGKVNITFAKTKSARPKKITVKPHKEG